MRAGKRTYYIDVRSTRSGNDFYLTITESKRGGEEEREKFKIFLYKEDFEKFREAFNQALDFVYGELGKINALPRHHARDDYRDDYQRDNYQRDSIQRDPYQRDDARGESSSREGSYREGSTREAEPRESSERGSHDRSDQFDDGVSREEQKRTDDFSSEY